MDSEQGPSTDQLRYLEGALKDAELPGELVAEFVDREKLRAAARKKAPAIVDEAESGWGQVRDAKRRVDELERPRLRRFLMQSAERPEDRLHGLYLVLFGSGLVGLSWFRPDSDALDDLWLYSGVVGVLLGASKWLRALPPSPGRWRLGLWLLGYAFVAWLYSKTVPETRIEDLLFFGGLAIALASACFYIGRDAIGLPMVARLRLAEERLRSAESAYERQLRAGALRRWRQDRSVVDQRAAHETALHVSDHSGLAEIDDPKSEVPTRTQQELLEKMKRMPGGTIGVSGARGAGKSTLLRAISAADGTRKGKPPLGEGKPPLGLVVDAPARYEPRDFALHLFARVCAAVVGPDRVREMRGSDRPFGYGLRSGSPLVEPWVLAGLAVFLAGAALTALAGTGVVEEVVDPVLWGAALAFAGSIWIFLCLVARLQGRRHLDPLPDGAKLASDTSIYTATLRLRQIWFQQSFSAGWSGGFRAPIGIEGGVEMGAELAEQQLSLPDVVDLFREFLRELASVREVRIGIDELDKMTDEDARRFLNEIKVLFGIPDCFFLISISEDAMSFFERRGLPVRDVFDSTFDEVIDVPRLPYQVSRKLLAGRIVGLPQPFACLLHCMSGGLPRDLIRAARALVELEEGTSLDDAAATLLGNSLRSKAAAARVAARAFRDEAHVTLLFDWLDGLPAEDFEAATLLATCEDFETNFLARLVEIRPVPDLAEERRELQALATQLVAYAYYAATIMQFLASFTDSSRIDAALATPQAGESQVDCLAAVTQTFATDLNTAWKALSRFRADLGLERCPRFPRAQPVSGTRGSWAEDLVQG